MTKSLALFALIAGLTTSVSAQQPRANAAPPPPTDLKPILAKFDLKDGDTVVFLGDSITHQCLYTQYVEDFFYTRYPKLRLRFHNAGVGGDRAADALARFEEDVAAFKPKYVSILLGMNDGRYTTFNHEIFAAYERDMTTLLDRLAGISAVAAPMTPTMFDSRAVLLNPGKPRQEMREKYYNAVLAFYGSWLREQAHDRGLGFVDMYSPLNNLTMTERKQNPAFTLIKDAVHPDAPGQVVMATAWLDGLVTKTMVSTITIASQPGGARKATATNGRISDFQDGDSLRFTFAANALPWVLPAEAAEGFKLTRAGHRYSNEKFTVAGLKPGKYELKIDGQPVGAWTDAQLGRGVELQENEKTPQYQQALKVAELNKERNDQAMRPLRNLWRDLKVKRNEINLLTLAKKAEALAAKKPAFEQWLATDFPNGVAKFKALVKDYEDRIYVANQPAPRKYELTRLP
jgi:lysophospholipase L1-like esterase